MFQYFITLALGLAVQPLSAAIIGFTDVLPNAQHANGISYLKEKEIISGYKDGSYRPERTVNRAEFIKVLTKLLVSPSDIDECIRTVTDHFTDVPENAWFAPFVCAAKKNGFIEGYADPNGDPSGRTFHPAETLNIAEASKILVKAFSLQSGPADAAVWYAPYISTLTHEQVIPENVQATGQAMTRGVMADMLWRLKENVKDQPSAVADRLLGAQCEWFTEDQIPQVDMQEVRRVWTSWINGARAAENLAPYTQNKELNRTATLWSLQARDAGTITHKRTAKAAYYDYAMIGDWFSDLDIDFANVRSTTFTENIGWGVYKCKKDDCTQDLIDAVRTTFDFYMSEKGKAADSHYRSIMKPDFRLVGMGIAVNPQSGRYYITTHYGTEITSTPDPVCP